MLKAEVPSRFIFSSAWGLSENPSLSAFEKWTARYVAAAPEERQAMENEGVLLAGARRMALAELIKEAPKQALASAVPNPLRAQLPDAVVALLEARVAGVAQLSKLGVSPKGDEMPAEPTYKKAFVNGREYRAYSYGRREYQTTKVDVSVLGVAVDGLLAVSESPLRVLDVGEVPAAGQSVNEICPVSGNQTPVASLEPLNREEQNAVEVAGEVYTLCHVKHVATLEERLLKAEDQAGPYRGALKVLSAHPKTAEDGGAGTSGIPADGEDCRPPVAWSTGEKKVLVIRVDFSDKPGTPVSDDGALITPTYVASLFNQADGIKDFYKQNSYHKTDLSITEADVTPVYRLPKTAAYYSTGDGTSGYDNELHLAAQALAGGTLVNGTLTGGTYTLANYERIGVVFSDLSNEGGKKIAYGGLGEITGDKFWINGSMNFKVCAHEIGHNYGANHCNLWQVNDGNPISAAGSSKEYGDPYGVMGKSNADINYHFDMWEKSILNWLPDSSVRTIATSGTYRVYRFDHPNANIAAGTANALALKVVKDSITDPANGRDYWIGLRQSIPNNNALANGAYILWGYNQNRAGDLLDMSTPGTNAQDAALSVGASFYDSVANVTITPVARGGTTPNEYLDVQVNFGAASGAAPVISGGTISITGTAAARQGTTFSVNASDADGDALSYSWDFGAGPAFSNSSTASYTWAVGGTYNVTVSVSDMKGHTTTATRTVTVADPMISWSSRSASVGSTAKFNALAANASQVLAVGEDFDTYKGPVALSSDGVTWSGTSNSTLGQNNHAYGAAWDGSKWVVAGMGYSSGWVGRILTSPDAVTWTSRYFTGPQLNSVVASGTLLVAVGDSGTIIRSTDGTTWSAVPSGTTRKLASVTWGGGKFVAVGYGVVGGTACAVLTSPNGSTWTDVSSAVGSDIVDLRKIAYGGNVFVASGLNSKLRYSSDATGFSTTRTTSEHSDAIAYGNGLWFAGSPAWWVGGSPTTVDLISTDGQNWTTFSPGTVDKRCAAIFFKDTFITVGENRSIRQSGVVSALPVINVPGTLRGIVGSPITGGTVTADQPVTFVATGLPSGISLNATTGVISGTPIASGTSTVTVTATSVNGTAAKTFDIVITLRVPLALTTPPVNTGMISGSASTVSIQLNDDVNAVSTTYQIRVAGGGALVGTAGSVTAGSAAFSLPLRAITASGSYEIVFTRTYLDASVETVVSNPFKVDVATWNDAAGRYDGLFVHNDGNVGDGAVNRGRILLTLTRTGAVSGYVQYTEAELLSGGSLLTPPPRTYISVLRRFVGVLSPVSGASLKFSVTKNLGLGARLGWEQLQIDADLSVSPPVLKATIADHATITADVSAAGALSIATMKRLPLTLNGGSAASAVGSYILSANTGGLGDNNGYVWAQVTSSGAVVWISRLSGCRATGLSAFNITDTGGTAVIHDARSVLASSQLSSTVLMGQINFIKSGTGTTTWTPSFGGTGQATGIEKYVSMAPVRLVSGVLTPYYDGARFLAGTSVSSRSFVNFSNGDGMQWRGSGVFSLPAALVTNDSMQFSIKDSSGAVLYKWIVDVSDSGRLKVTGSPSENGVQPPWLTLAFNIARGEWSGYYFAPGSGMRVSIFGVPTSQPNDSAVRAVGWTESGSFPNQSIQTWILK